MKTLSGFISESLLESKNDYTSQAKALAGMAKKWNDWCKTNYKGENKEAMKHFNKSLMDSFNDTEAMLDQAESMEGFDWLEDFLSSDAWDNWMENFEPEDYEDFKQMFEKHYKKFIKF